MGRSTIEAPSIKELNFIAIFQCPDQHKNAVVKIKKETKVGIFCPCGPTKFTIHPPLILSDAMCAAYSRWDALNLARTAAAVA